MDVGYDVGLRLPKEWKGLEFLDALHDYPDARGNVRYYHFLKAAVARRFIRARAGAGSFLDAGAGRGPYTFLAARYFEEIYCFEYDSRELAHAEAYMHSEDRIRFRQVDLTRMPLVDGAVAVAVCSEVLEHIPDYNKAASELYRVLAPGGALLLSMPNARSLMYRRIAWKNRHLRGKAKLSYDEWELMRHFSFTAHAIERIAISAGFAIVSRRGVNVLPVPGFARRFLWKYPLVHGWYLKVDQLLGRLMPSFGSFYFLELRKP